jgi:hypothetical protein
VTLQQRFPGFRPGINAFQDSVLGSFFLQIWFGETTTGIHHKDLMAHNPLTLNIMRTSNPDSLTVLSEATYSEVDSSTSMIQEETTDSLGNAIVDDLPSIPQIGMAALDVKRFQTDACAVQMWKQHRQGAKKLAKSPYIDFSIDSKNSALLSGKISSRNSRNSGWNSRNSGFNSRNSKNSGFNSRNSRSGFNSRNESFHEHRMKELQRKERRIQDRQAKLEEMQVVIAEQEKLVLQQQETLAAQLIEMQKAQLRRESADGIPPASAGCFDGFAKLVNLFCYQSRLSSRDHTSCDLAKVEESENLTPDSRGSSGRVSGNNSDSDSNISSPPATPPDSSRKNKWSVVAQEEVALHSTNLDVFKVAKKGSQLGVVEILGKLEKQQEDPDSIICALLRLSLLVDGLKKRQVQMFLNAHGEGTLLLLASNSSPFLVRMFATVNIALLLNHGFLLLPMEGLNERSSFVVEQMITVIGELETELTYPELGSVSIGIAEAGVTTIIESLTNLLRTGWVRFHHITKKSLTNVVNLLKYSLDALDLRNFSSQFLADCAAQFGRPYVKLLMSVDIMVGMLRLVEHGHGLEQPEPWGRT